MLSGQWFKQHNYCTEAVTTHFPFDCSWYADYDDDDDGRLLVYRSLNVLEKLWKFSLAVSDIEWRRRLKASSQLCQQTVRKRLKLPTFQCLITYLGYFFSLLFHKRMQISSHSPYFTWTLFLSCSLSLPMNTIALLGNVFLLSHSLALYLCFVHSFVRSFIWWICKWFPMFCACFQFEIQ